MSPIQAYLSALDTVRRSGAATQERSLYGALQALLNQVGATLAPKVTCVSEPADIGAGRPDYALFTAPPAGARRH